MFIQILTEKEAPHEQPSALCGLFAMRNEERISSVWNSTCAPRTRDSETSSTTTWQLGSQPKILSSELVESSRSNLYWKPEQPPPSTTSLSILVESLPAFSSLSFCLHDSLIFKSGDSSWEENCFSVQ